MSKKFAGTVIWNNPYVIYCPFVPNENWWGFEEIENELSDRKVYFLKNIYWSVEDQAGIDRVKNWMSYRVNTNHHFIWMANSKKEVNVLRGMGLNVFLIHQNSFIDPDLFHIVPSPKKYNAVYNAAIMPYKRVELACKVENVALISRDRDIDYYNKVIPSGNFELINQIIDGSLSFITRDKVNEIYAQSSCGLCLSSLEGAMFSSLEYLLSGIPVVSTRSLGGRDFFFDRNNSIIVDDNENAVSEAVNYWVSNSNVTTPLQIRLNAIQMQRVGIESLKVLIAKILFDHNVFVNIDDLYNFSYTNALARHHPVDDFINLENLRIDSFGVI